MAARAVDRHAAGRRHHLGDHVVEIVGPCLAPQDVALGLDLPDEVPRTGGEESRGHDVIWIVRRQHVSGDLPPEELVVREIAVQGVDHPVAIPPGIGAQLVPLEAVGVGVVGDVEPVSGPASP